MTTDSRVRPEPQPLARLTLERTATVFTHSPNWAPMRRARQWFFQAVQIPQIRRKSSKSLASRLLSIQTSRFPRSVVDRMRASNSSGRATLNRLASNHSSVSTLASALPSALPSSSRDPFDAADVWHHPLPLELGQVQTQRLLQFSRKDHHRVKELEQQSNLLSIQAAVVQALDQPEFPGPTPSRIGSGFLSFQVSHHHGRKRVQRRFQLFRFARIVKQLDDGKLDSHGTTEHAVAELIGPPRWLFITHYSQAYDRLPVPVVDSVVVNKHPLGERRDRAGSGFRHG